MRLAAVGFAAVSMWLLLGGPVPTHRGPSLRLRGKTLGALAISALLLGTVGLGMTGVPAVGGAFALLGAAGPLLASRLSRLRAKQAARDHWPDFLASVQGELAGGSSLPEAFSSAGRRHTGRLRDLDRFVSEMLAGGVTFPEALEAARARQGDPIADRVLITLAMAHKTGGPRVASMLAGLADSVADELRLRKAHEAALTQQRLTALVALLAPWMLLVLTISTNPTANQAYRTHTGSVVLAVGLSATLIGYVLTIRTARLSEPPRVFR